MPCVNVVWIACRHFSAFAHERRSLRHDCCDRLIIFFKFVLEENDTNDRIASDAGVRDEETIIQWCLRLTCHGYWMQNIKSLMASSHIAITAEVTLTFKKKWKKDRLTKANSPKNTWHTSCKKFEGITQPPYHFSIQGNTLMCSMLVKVYRCIRSGPLLHLTWISTQISV